MKSILAGFGNAPELHNNATVLCNDGKEYSIKSCDTMEEACSLNGGAKICSGGEN
ncbi:hypothetical protein [Kordia periserrulae]|nr:hypothetical protein [Kordia periserrulae]